MKPSPPSSVKLFCGILYVAQESCEQAQISLESAFSSIDYVSPAFDFDSSDYYEKEMGAPIKRRFISFEKLIHPGALPQIKLKTNLFEVDFSVEARRKVNFDPGYMDFNKVILASAKYNSQKIYLDSGIYADPTLWYEKGRFKPYPHAFPDFKNGMYNQVFLDIRTLMKAASKNQEANVHR